MHPTSCRSISIRRCDTPGPPTNASKSYRVVYEVRGLNITAHGELAFVHGLNHVTGTLASGHHSDMWVRWTACFRRIEGVWLVVHDHVSVPADLEHGAHQNRHRTA